MRARFVRACYLAWMAGQIAVYYIWPGTHLYTWGAIGLSGGLGVLIGIRLNRPPRPLAWYLMATALFCFAVGDIIYYVMQSAGPEPAFPGAADYFYLAVYVFLAASFLLFIRATSGDNRSALIDALVPTVGLGLLAWVFLIAEYARDDSLTLIQKLVSIGYPLGDMLALAMLLRLLAEPGRRPAAVRVVALGIVALLITDVIYGLSRLDSAWVIGGPVDLGWVVFYAALGYAALMPSMAGMTVRSGVTEPDVASPRRLRMIYLSAASLVAPAVLLVEDLLGKVTDVPVIAAAAACMLLLVVARVDGLLRTQEQAGARERALREIGALLSSASTVEEVRQCIRDATVTLMPDGETFHLDMLNWIEADDTDQVAPPDLVAAGDLRAEHAAPRSDPVLYMKVRLPLDPVRIGSAVLSAPERALREVQPAFLALFQQITVVLERIRLSAEVNHRDSEAYFRTLIQSASDVILIVDDDDSIRYASPSAETVFGRAELAGGPLTALIADTHHDALGDVLTRARLGHEGRLDGADLTAVCGDRRLVQIECTARDLRADPTVRGIVLTLWDVTERRRLEDDLAHQAFHDNLTGLANRVLFRNRLEHAFALAERDGTRIGVLFVDLDDFKEVNDTLGHAVGDQLLVAVGQRIAHTIGAGNTAARMGGDEFAILVEHNDDPGVIEEVAARIVEVLSAPIDLSDGLGGMYVVSGASSVGVATSRDAASATELLRHADLALYLAKEAGKGTWQPYRNELHTAMVERHEMRTALHEAVDDEQFVLRYQPIVDLTDGRLTGLEALVRWQHPVRGLLGPNHFIELAEENGAILGIGTWVLRESLRRIADWKAAAPDGPLRYISVNVSARQFRTPGFVAQVRQALADTGSRPEWLLLEITESLVLRDAEQVWADLGELRAMGVRIAIDDFGTGYSSLSYLRQMPVDVLKVDKSFIDDVLGSRQQRALVEAIVTLARNLDLVVVAEGIEEPAQRDLLLGMRCPYGQGYLFAKPVPAETVETWLSGSQPIGEAMLTARAPSGVER